MHHNVSVTLRGKVEDSEARVLLGVLVEDALTRVSAVTYSRAFVVDTSVAVFAEGFDAVQAD
jgi:phosphoribosylformylglycinamidine (FGAM) synthase PurS component